MSGADDDDLRQSIEALKQDLWKSAQIGKSLLAENEELNGQLELLRKQHSAQIELLEQEKHVLTMKLTNATHMESVYCEEIESLRETMLSQRAAADHEAEGRHAAEVTQLQAKLAEALSRIKELEAVERAAADERVTLEARLDAAMELRRQDGRGDKGTARHLDESALSRTATEEEVAAQLKLHQQLDEAVQCQMMLHEHVEQATSRALGAEALARRQVEQIATLREDVEDAQSQAASFSCALERLRLENQDLRAELDTVKVMSQGHKAKGNSMFAELEDKRVGAEMRIVSLLVENKSLVAECDQYRKQLRNVKAQMASVLQMSSGSVDAEHVRQLEQRLADATGRAEELTRALQRCESVEANEASRKLSTVAASCSAATASSVANAASVKGTKSSAATAAAIAVVDIGYAQSLLKSKDDQLDKLRSELQVKRYELLAESSKLQESQRRQRETDGLVAKLRAENMQLAVRLEEMAAASAAIATTAAPARSTDKTRACSGVVPSGAQESCDSARRLPLDLPAAAARLPMLAAQTDEPRPASAEAAAVSTATAPCHADRPQSLQQDSCTASAPVVAKCLDNTAGAGSTVTSSDVQPDRAIGERHAAVTAAAAGIGGVVNPRTAARLAKMEQSSRQPAAKETGAARLMPKLTARASASDPTSGVVAAGASQKRRSELAEGPMRKVSGNIPLSEEVTSEIAKLEGLARPSGVLPLPQLSSAGSNASEDLENCRTQ